MVRLHLIAAVAPFSDFRFSHFALGTLQQMGNLEVEVSCLLNFHGRPSEGPHSNGFSPSQHTTRICHVFSASS
jgi:hypothetical protein